MVIRGGDMSASSGTQVPHNAIWVRPSDEELDLFGLTHAGKVRAENQDHFLISALKKQMVIRQTSLPEADHLMGEPERLASLAMVADGVGGGTKGEEASRIALGAVAKYVSSSMRCYYAAGLADDREFSEALEKFVWASG